jgi:hypothetical protein
VYERYRGDHSEVTVMGDQLLVRRTVAGVKSARRLRLSDLEQVYLALPEGDQDGWLQLRERGRAGVHTVLFGGRQVESFQRLAGWLDEVVTANGRDGRTAAPAPATSPAGQPAASDQQVQPAETAGTEPASDPEPTEPTATEPTATEPAGSRAASRAGAPRIGPLPPSGGRHSVRWLAAGTALGALAVAGLLVLAVLTWPAGHPFHDAGSPPADALTTATTGPGGHPPGPPAGRMPGGPDPATMGLTPAGNPLAGTTPGRQPVATTPASAAAGTSATPDLGDPGGSRVAQGSGCPDKKHWVYATATTGATVQCQPYTKKNGKQTWKWEPPGATPSPDLTQG